MTYYTSTVSTKGNICYSNLSQEEADAKALELDMNNCTNCADCEDCSDCSDCNNCDACTDCTNCECCDACTDCTNCEGCIYCEGCRRCKDCIQSNSVSDWKTSYANKAEVKTVLGLRWLVATDGNYIRIGCQFHSVQDWEEFEDHEIAYMHEFAASFWNQYKIAIITFAKAIKTSV